MGAFDFLLNLAGVLLWLSWRSLRFDPLLKSTPVTLIGTLKRAESRPIKNWLLVAALAGLILLRGACYLLIGAPADWTPKLNLELVVLAFRSDLFVSAMVFSCLSFLRVLILFYFWLIVLGLINRSSPDNNSIQRLVRLHLGSVARWPWPLQLLTPLVLVVLLWVALHPVLLGLGVVTPAVSKAHLFEQGSLVALGLCLSLKYLLPPFLLMHLVASYVYLGSSAFWDFIALTSVNLTTPLRRLPLRLARVDLTPVAGAVLILLVLEWLPNLILSRLEAQRLSVWPL
jgi:hypothetical protein